MFYVSFALVKLFLYFLIVSFLACLCVVFCFIACLVSFSLSRCV